MSVMNWELTYKAKRHGGAPGTQASMEGAAPMEFTQTADAAFTIECLDILLADETVTWIELKAGVRSGSVPFVNDDGERRSVTAPLPAQPPTEAQLAGMRAMGYPV